MATKKKSSSKKSFKLSKLQVIIFVLIFGVIGALAIVNSFAAKNTITGTCRFDNTTYAPNNWVFASGLPTGKAINFFVIDSSGSKTGIPLGSTSDGTTGTIVTTPSGPTTYEFTGKGYGKSGDIKYDVYARCTAG